MTNTNLSSLPTATDIRDAFALQNRYSGRHPHVIVVAQCSEHAERYFVVTDAEAKHLYAQGMEPLWPKS